MKEFIRLFAQIAVLRRGPQDLPASVLLLVLTVIGYLGVNLVLGSALPPDTRWREWLLRRFGEDSTWQVPITCAGLLLFVWLVAANSQIVRAALEWSATSSVALVILQTLVSWLLQFTLFPPVKS